MSSCGWDHGSLAQGPPPAIITTHSVSSSRNWAEQWTSRGTVAKLEEVGGGGEADPRAPAGHRLHARVKTDLSWKITCRKAVPQTCLCITLSQQPSSPNWMEKGNHKACLVHLLVPAAIKFCWLWQHSTRYWTSKGQFPHLEASGNSRLWCCSRLKGTAWICKRASVFTCSC